MSGLYLGLDIGGTKCAIVSGTENCEILSRYEIKTRDYCSWQAVIDALLDHRPEGGFQAVGVSCGGPLDSRRCMPVRNRWAHVLRC